MVSQLEGWLDQLERNANSGDLRIADTSKWDPSTLAEQRARVRAPRGPARLAGPLGGDLKRDDLPLPGGRADDLERLAARCAGATRPV